MCNSKYKREKGTPCENHDCRNWIEYPDEMNCVLNTIDLNGSLTLEEVAKRLKVSHVRIKQIEDKALEKVKRELKE